MRTCSDLKNMNLVLRDNFSHQNNSIFYTGFLLSVNNGKFVKVIAHSVNTEVIDMPQNVTQLSTEVTSIDLRDDPVTDPN